MVVAMDCGKCRRRHSPSDGCPAPVSVADQLRRELTKLQKTQAVLAGDDRLVEGKIEGIRLALRLLEPEVSGPYEMT